MGAVLVDEDGKILARAFNQPIGLHDPTAHAEILVLREGAAAPGDSPVAGIKPLCYHRTLHHMPGAILAARVRRVVFGAPDPKGGACVSLYRIPEDACLNHRLESPAASGRRNAGSCCSSFLRPGVEGSGIGRF